MLVTVYIPTKNRRAMLERAVDSVLAQTYESIELIVVDDGSSDETRAYLEAMSAKGALKAIFMPVSGGACAARNLAIGEARGELVTGLDDDDYFLPHRIEALVKKWQELHVSGKPFSGVFDSVSEVGRYGSFVHHTNLIATAEGLCSRQMVGNQALALKENYLQSGLFDPEMPIWQDWDLWIRMARKFGDFSGVNQCSYVMDVSHDYARISAKPSHQVRQGYQRFIEKYGPFTRAMRASQITSLARYRSVSLSLRELLILIVMRRFSVLLRYAFIKTFGVDSFERIRFSFVKSSGR